MKRRIFLFYLVLVTLVSSAVALIAYRMASDLYLSEISTSLERDSKLLVHILNAEKWVESGRITDADIRELSELAQTENEPPWRLTIIHRSGKVLADSQTQAERMGNHVDRPEVAGALKNGTGSRIRRSPTVGWDYLYFARYVAEQDLIVRLAAPLTAINAIKNTLLFNTVATIIAGIIISAFIAQRLSERLTKPIAGLVERFGSRSPKADKRAGSKDEIGDLSRTLEQMAARIETVILELKDRNARMDTLIDSLEYGLIAVDNQMRIIIINPVARRMFDISEKVEAIDKPLIQVLRNLKLNDMLEEAIRTHRNLTDEDIMYHGGKRIIALSVSPIKPLEGEAGNPGAIAYIRDITNVRKLEEIRSEFVSNVTHELKTPLTSIRGFVETLKNGAVRDPKVAEKFLDIIDIEADRLNHLINDILELSEIEGMKHDSDTSLFALKPLVDEIAAMLEPATQEKGITISNKVEVFIEINANRTRIKQLMINLMDNAVKYNKENGSIDIWVEKAENSVTIHVRDTGIGIPESHHSRIFERFYRVDKGRSREMGGTGLGLSIVKHIAGLYGGSVQVISGEEKGSEFIVSLPQPPC